MEQVIQTETETSLTLTRIFPISQERLWKIWTDGNEISKWHRPNLKDYTTQAQADLRVGGSFRISMKEATGEHTAFGLFKEIDPPKRLVYSWQWENDPSGEISEVTIDLKPVEGGTELRLVHSRLSGPESVQAHLAGWVGCMENILILEKR